ncbi:Dabb family protein [Photobacterium lipolyticum]|uniref:Stress protein n=1 Tax=Photobacterium lipolyticum TaxID=266810 RepID=A0A2T3N2K3_9GAMM|nr:Dabb family protein [Photobacterium lipolyticum]PSW06568.1 stress protein [Photobacterium lipolyticum]
MIRHILLIQFKADAPLSQIDAVKDAFIAFPETVDGVEAVEWGENDSPEGKNRGYTHCVLMTFRDEASRQTYLPHPKHDALKSIFRPVLEEIIVLDYTVR